MSSSLVISAESVYKRFEGPAGAIQILEDVSLDINQGQSVAIVGASGSGKTTLLGLLAGLDLPSSGRISLAGADLTQLDEDGRAAVRNDHVGFVFQSFHLLPALTALENAALALEMAGDSKAMDKALKVLQRVGLEERADHYPNQLSGGEKQRVAIARAFAGRPQILFADEPTGNLDRATGNQIADLLFQLNRDEGTTLVLVTHDLNLAANCDETYEIESGRLVVRQEALSA